jgi:hypothetical protein
MRTFHGLIGAAAAAQEKPKAATMKAAGLDIMLMQPMQPKAGDNKF